MEQFLVSAADREACDWLVLGLQGRTALAALLMGSTTDRVLKLADRPVLVIPMTSPLSGKPTN
jgi:nucleotide-binding universal stress UspA family protein